LQYSGAARFVYNWALADRIARYESGNPTNRFEQMKRFNSIKYMEFPWIKDIPYVVQQEAIKNLDDAYSNFFRRVKSGADKKGFPKFKSRYQGVCNFSFRGSIHIDRNKIKLPIIGWLKLAQKDYLPLDGQCKINKATVSGKSGKWFVSIQVEVNIPDPVAATGDPIGIDVGINKLAVLSDGREFDVVDSPTLDNKIKRLQRELARRTKGGVNWNKTKIKLGRLMNKVSSIRTTNLHAISKTITNGKPATIVVENLNIAGMVKNNHLSKSIQESAWGELQRQLGYKSSWNGIEFIKADRWYPSSKICSNCGNKKEVLLLSDRIYKCDNCGLIINRDLNAAINLAALSEGQNEPGLPGELICNNVSL
jgi:putative transposase